MARDFICSGCGKRISDPRNQFERRTEYRRLSDMGRERVFKEADVCGDCMGGEIAARTPSAGTPQAMFDG
jgi:hypothetical protein